MSTPLPGIPWTSGVDDLTAMVRRDRINGATLTSDAFTGGNVTNIEGRATDCANGGKPFTWQANTTPSGLGIVSGRLARTSGSSQRRVGFDAGSGDVTLRAKAIDNAGTFGAPILQIRRADVSTTATDHYKIEIGTTGLALLRKNVGGVNTTLYSHPDPVTPAMEIGVFAKGTTVGMTLDGEIVYSVTDTDIPATRTWVALQVQTQAMLVDDLIVGRL